jgi:cell division protein FtsW (lipid II flippase)
VFIQREQIKSDLKIFLIIVATLITIGLLFIYSSSYAYAIDKF